MKKSLAVILALVMVLSLTLSGCGSTKEDETPKAPTTGSTTEEADPHVVIKAGHTGNEESVYNQCFVKFAELVDEYSGGTVEVQVFGDAQLGAERDTLEGMQLGTVDMALADSSVWANFVPEYSMLSGFYMVENVDQAYAVSQSEVYDFLTAESENQGLHVLTWLFCGSRNVFGTKEWTSFEDFAGAKLRTMENAVQQKAFSELGFIPIPMAMSEVVSALQQGTVDAAENALVTIHQMGFDDVAKYVSMTNHMYTTGVFAMSNSKWESLTAAQQEAVSKAAAEVQTYGMDVLAEVEESVRAEMESEGVTITEIEVPEEVKNTIRAMYDGMEGMPAEYLDIIKEIATR